MKSLIKDKEFTKRGGKIWTMMMMIMISPYLHSREIILITYEDRQIELANMVQRILEKQFLIPGLLIKKRESLFPCEQKIASIIHICFKENGEMLVPYISTEVQQGAFSIFLNP